MTGELRRIWRNDSVDSARATVAPSGTDVLAFHRSMPAYRRTPLVDAPSVATRLGVGTCLVKDESDRLGMPSFKILGASWATFRALCHHVGRDHRDINGLAGLKALLADRGPITLVAATDGNHGRAVARMARQLGLDSHILVPIDMVPARIEALRYEGARVTVVPGTYDEAVAASARQADTSNVVISDTSWEGYETIPRWVIDGYATIARETLDQLDEAGAALPTIMAVQMGVGSFAAAMVRGFEGVRVVGVEPTRAACVLAGMGAGAPRPTDAPQDSIMAGLNSGTPSRVAWDDLVSGIEWFAAVTDNDAEEAMRVLADAGVESGESGAAGLAGLLAFGREIGLGPSDRVLVFSTEGATDPDGYRRILSTHSVHGEKTTT